LDRNLQRCSAGKHAKLKLVFMGDSHAMDLFPMADKLYEDGIASVLNVFQPSCKIVPIDPGQCAYPNLLIPKLASERPQDTILVLRENSSPRRVNGDLSTFSNALEKLLDTTSAAGMKVIYILPAPKYDSVGSLCAPQWFRPAWAMAAQCRNGYLEDRGEEIARRRDITENLVDLSKKRSDFYVFDPFELFCGTAATTCTPLRDGKLIYRDSSHLTGQGSELLAAPFEAFLKDNHLIPPSPTP
jgi:hypothetical protein